MRKRLKKEIEKEIIRNNTILHTHFCHTGEKDHIRSTVARTFVIAKDWLNMQPTIEAKPVVHAHWEKVREGLHICSYCKVKAPIESDEYDYMESLSTYCPLCGALMDENHIAEGGKKEE